MNMNKENNPPTQQKIEKLKEANEEILNEMAKTRKLKKATTRRYKLVLNRYSIFHNMTLEELLDEADEEEELRIRHKKRKIKKRIMDFRTYVYDTYMKATAKSNVDTVLTFYRHFELEIPLLPPVSTKNTRENPPLLYSDLLTKDILKKVLDMSTPKMKALILFSISSGSANAETMSLTIQDFIDATSNNVSNYHNSNDIYEVIRLLINRDDVVPTFFMKRKKTNKFYYTFCTPEATHAILSYLQGSQRKLVPEDKLFRIHPNSVARTLADMNEDLGLGKKGTYNRLRTHMFRKFNASNLRKAGMSMDDVNSIQGKGKNRVNEPYFFDSPEQLKKVYITFMDAVLIDWNMHEFNIKSKEYEMLEEELDKRNAEYDKLKDRVSSLETIITSNISDDEREVISKYI